MKLAVASQDGVNISQHFGRSRYFLVFEVEDGRILNRSVRENVFTTHAQGECKNGEDHHHAGHRDHVQVVAALQDCQAVICRGMGRRAAEELEDNGIHAIVAADEMLPEEAVKQYLSGMLSGGDGFCPCHEA